MGQDVQGNDVALQSYHCLQTQDGMRGILEIDLPTSFIIQNDHLLHNNPVLRLTGSVEIRDNVLLPTKVTKITLHSKSSPHRRLAPVAGQLTALVVRVVTANQEPVETVEELEGRVFGVGPFKETNTVLTQLNKCSFGALRLQAPVDNTNVTRKGVVQVTVDDMNINDCNIVGDCQAVIVNATETTLGQSLDAFDFVMFCVPTGSKFGRSGKTDWSAFAYAGQRTAWFQRGFCGVLTTNMHELGHLMGFGHSNENNNIREDKSGALGRSVRRYGGPRYCLNGQKYSMSGWMDDRKEIVTLEKSDDTDSHDANTTGYTVRLVAFVDFEKSMADDDRTLIQIQTSEPRVRDIFVVFNRKKFFNDGVREKGDTVTVVQEGNNKRESNMMAGLDSGDNMTIPETSIVIEVCEMGTERVLETAVEGGYVGVSTSYESILDYATISVYDESRGQRSGCGAKWAKEPNEPQLPVLVQRSDVPTASPTLSLATNPSTKPMQAVHSKEVTFAAALDEPYVFIIPDAASLFFRNAPSSAPTEGPVRSPIPTLPANSTRAPVEAIAVPPSDAPTKALIQTPTKTPTLVLSKGPSWSPSRLPTQSPTHYVVATTSWGTFEGGRCYFLKDEGERCQFSIQCCSGQCIGNGWSRTCQRQARDG